MDSNKNDAMKMQEEKTSGQNSGKYGNKVIGTDGNDEAAHNNLGCHIH